MSGRIGRFFKSIAESRGFSPTRIILTLFYALNVGFGAIRFTSSMGDYVAQGVSLIMFGGGCYMTYRSLRKMFDEGTCETLRRISRKLGDKVTELIGKLVGVVIKKLGLERKRVRGEDERDFVFKERERTRRRARKMKNPHVWADADNAGKIRYIFTEYMFRRIRDGYRLLPWATPKRIAADLVSEDIEQELFDYYEMARYSGGREVISNAGVEELSELVDRKKKKKQ